VVPSKNPETDIDAAHLGVCASGGYWGDRQYFKGCANGGARA
jgi:hypothetical protein